MVKTPADQPEFMAGERYWVVYQPHGQPASAMQEEVYDDFGHACQAVARMNAKQIFPDMIVERVYLRREYSNVSATCQMRLRHGGVAKPVAGLKRRASFEQK